MGMIDVNNAPYQFLAQNFVVSGSGRIEIPAIKTPTYLYLEEWGLVAITVQNHSNRNFLVKQNRLQCLQRSTILLYL